MLDDAGPRDGGDLERDRIGVEQVLTLHANARVGVPGAVAGLPVVAWLLVDLGSITWRAGAVWVGTLALVSGAQIWQGLRWARSPDRSRSWRGSARRFTAWAFCEALLWACGPVACTGPAAPERQTLMIAVLVGVAFGGAAAFASHLPASLTFLFAATAPVVVACVVEGGKLLNGAALLLAVGTFVIALLARRSNAVFVNSVRLRIANEDLAGSLRAQRDRAEQASVAKSRFLAAASHDLRQPVHALSLLTEAFSRRGMTEADLRVLELMRQSVGALDGLFDALLDISRLDAGLVAPRVRPFALGPLLGRLAAEHRPRAEAKGLRLAAPACAQTAEGDPVLVERAVRNLLDNALRYTDRGGVLLACRPRGGRLAVQVWDTGRGIPADEQERVFEEFHQLHNPERDRGKGLGLGLSIVRRLAELMDAPVRLRSRPGSGSMFEVLLPVGLLAPAPVVAPAAAEAAPAGRGLVLVIDDEAAIRETMRLLLEGWGHPVLAAGSGDEMLEAVAQAGAAPALILCDYRLRAGENGIGAVARLRAACGRDVPAILVTGDTAPDRLAEAEASGLLLLHKPVSPGRLRAAVGALAAGAPDLAPSEPVLSDE